jgi:hypothetical protein
MAACKFRETRRRVEYDLCVIGVSERNKKVVVRAEAQEIWVAEENAYSKGQETSRPFSFFVKGGGTGRGSALEDMFCSFLLEACK